MQPFNDYLSTRGHLTGLRNRPELKQTDGLLVVVHTWIVSLCIRSSNKCESVSCLCAHKYSFGKVGHVMLSYICLYHPDYSKDVGYTRSEEVQLPL